MGMLVIPPVLRDLADDSEKHVLNETLREIARRGAVADGDTLRNTTLLSPAITTPTLSGAAPATPVVNVLYTDSVVKGWVRFDGTGVPAIVDDLNVSSITDNGVGDYTVNWATVFANANYALVGMPTQNLQVTISTTAVTAGAAAIFVRNNADAAADSSSIFVIAIGDQ